MQKCRSLTFTHPEKSKTCCPFYTFNDYSTYDLAAIRRGSGRSANQHSAIADAAAVGIPSEEWGEVIALAVVLATGQCVTEDELRSHIREHLRSSRVPEAIHFSSELPYNETGKLLRRVVREWFK